MAGRPCRLGRPRRALPTAGCFGLRIPQESAYAGVFEPGPAPQVGLLPASGHFLAGCKSVSRTRRLVIRAGGLPPLRHALAPVSTCGTLWPVCRRKRPAASDAGMPSSGRRFRPRSSRRHAGVCGRSSRPRVPARLLRCGGKKDSAARRFLRAAARQARRAQSEQRSGGSPFLFRIMSSNTESAALQPARRSVGRQRSVVAVRGCSRGRDRTGRGHSVLRKLYG